MLPKQPGAFAWFTVKMLLVTGQSRNGLLISRTLVKT